MATTPPTRSTGPTGRTERVIHLVPTLRPPPEGVGEFALALARALAERGGADNRFVVCRPGWAGPTEGVGFEVAALSARTPRRLADVLAELLEDAPAPGPTGAAVLLHYSGYGYDPRGRPDWLAHGLGDGLAALRRRRPVALVTTFHEVFATGPPWTRAFWDSRRQRRIARRLLGLSDAAVTSLELYADLLRPWAADLGGRPVAVLPVGSTVGEPDRVPPPDQRPARMVVFGGAGNRRRVYEVHRQALAAACAHLGLEEIVDVGPDPSVAPTRIEDPAGPLPVTALGPVDDSRVREVLFGARAGFLAYAPAFFPKSTVFAAYCAHGLVPAASCAHDPTEPDNPTGLVPGHHFWAPETANDRQAPSGIARAARAWYQEHTFDRQAELYLRLFAATGDDAEAAP